MLQDNSLVDQRHALRFSKWRKLLCVLLWAILDVLVSTLLILRCRFDRLHPEVFISVNGYAFSLLDIWILGPIRSLLIFGSLLGVMYNPADGTERVKLLNRIVTLTSVLMWSYPQIKMLIYTENAVDFSPEWFWPFFVWSEACALMFVVNWRLLGSCAAGKLAAKTAESINSTDEERKSLLDNRKDNGSKEDDKEKKPVTSARTKAANVLRLLVMSKPDLGFISLASIFMVASSTGIAIIVPYMFDTFVYMVFCKWMRIGCYE